MKMRTAIIFIFLLLVSLLKPLFAGDAKVAEELHELVAKALADNPELKASDARWRMFSNRVAHEGRWEDPMLMLKIQNGILRDPFNFGRDPMTQKVIGISQQIPFWGKRELRREAAVLEAESYQWLYEERKLELKRMVAESYYRIYATDRFLDIVDKNIKILDDFVTLAETRYSVGQGAQQDVFKAQVERSKLLDMRISLEQQRRSLQAALNALLYRPADTTIGRIPDFDINPLSMSAAELKRIALDKRPILKSLKLLIDKGETARKLAKKEFYPDFNLSMEYMQRDPAGGEEGLDMYSLGVTFNLPVRRHHRHEMVAEADAAVNMAGEELNGLKNSIDAGIADLLAQLERRIKLVELYRTGIIPQADQSLESAVIGYRVGKVDFLTLLDNRMTLFNYERELYDSMADYQMKKAELEALVGKEL